MPRLVLHETYEEILVRAKPDPNRPHSSTAPRPKTAAMRAGWYSLRDEDGVLRAVVTTSGRGIRLLDISLPNTMILGLAGRTVSEVIDHPSLVGTAVIKGATKSDPVDPGSDDAFTSMPWFAIQTRKSVIEPSGEHVDSRSKGMERLRL